MTHERTLELLDDYVEGTLPPHDERGVRRHLMQCDDCRAEERELRTLLDEAAALPPGIQPPVELWEGIAARLEPRSATVALAPEIPVIGPRPVRRIPWWMQAAAAIALVVTTSVVTLQIDRAGPAQVAAVQQQPAAQQAAAPAARTALAAFHPAEQEYQRAIGDLEQMLGQHRDKLAPQTVATLEANLKVIDKAIQESRAALAADPNSRELATMLSQSYDAKLDVLQRAVSL
ncbi:MAG TPA: anti-sigma factor [Longimicrobium sp.]|jgi:tetratricopeptide (TPR) repeat protein|uniref:anti-sigma factor n=1 Tax=Longimicrobium sp. TaxID=2029185 RepID=UPI002ED8943C